METTKWVILDTSDIQMSESEIEVYRVSKKLTRIFKEEWREVIYTERSQKIWIRKSVVYELE